MRRKPTAESLLRRLSDACYKFHQADELGDQTQTYDRMMRAAQAARIFLRAPKVPVD